MINFRFIIIPVIVFAPLTALAQIEWKESYYNPAPLSDDLILPMPCGGAMAFRPIEVSGLKGEENEIRMTLGESNAKNNFISGVRQAYIAAPFSADETHENPHFFMAKYEIAQAQYDALNSESCPENAPRKKNFIPASNLSKLEIEQFAQNYTIWLNNEFPDLLPQANEAVTYLRLPDEVEWEFAARGGSVVEEAVFRAPYPQLHEGEGLYEYIASGDQASTAGKVQVIGTLKPNALGLHDMLGNVSEYVETSFSLINFGRHYGRIGGDIKRGGDARTPVSEFNNATRIEVSPIDSVNLTISKDAFTGARLVLSTLAVTNLEEIRELERIAEEQQKAQSKVASEGEISELIDDLIASASNDNEREAFTIIQSALTKFQSDLRFQRAKSVELITISAILTCDQSAQRLMQIEALKQSVFYDLDQLENEAKANNDQKLLLEIEAAREDAIQQVELTKEKIQNDSIEYSNMVDGIVNDFTEDSIANALQEIASKVNFQEAKRHSCLQTLQSHIQTRSKNGFFDTKQAMQSFEELAEQYGSF